MSEMIERAARAIAVSLEVSPESWRQHVDEARAVIAAMREPTAAILKIARYADNGDDHNLGEIAGKAVWQAMIDEALKPTAGPAPSATPAIASPVDLRSD